MTNKPIPKVPTDDEPLFNIGAVSRMTGISMANLRAWERRYNFPETKRTEGGHRLYSEYDLYKLQWVKSKIKSGMQTASAINLFRHQEQSDQLVALNYHSQKIGTSVKEEILSFHGIKPKLINALVNNDLSKADEILGNLMAIYSPEDLLVELITPVLSEIGEKWQRGEISISNEHLVSNYLRHRTLMWMLSSPPPKDVSPILLACAPHEWHEGSLLILGTLLRRRRWPVAYMGQSIPLSDLTKFIDEIKPSLVVIVAMTEKTVAELKELSRYLTLSDNRTKPIIGFGGRIFVDKPGLREGIPGYYLGNTFLEGVNNIEDLINSFTG